MNLCLPWGNTRVLGDVITARRRGSPPSRTVGTVHPLRHDVYLVTNVQVFNIGMARVYREHPSGVPLNLAGPGCIRQGTCPEGTPAPSIDRPPAALERAIYAINPLARYLQMPWLAVIFFAWLSYDDGSRRLGPVLMITRLIRSLVDV